MTEISCLYYNLDPLLKPGHLFAKSHGSVFKRLADAICNAGKTNYREKPKFSNILYLKAVFGFWPFQSFQRFPGLNNEGTIDLNGLEYNYKLDTESR